MRVLGALLLLLAGAAAFWLLRPGPAPGGPNRFVARASCIKCHEEAYLKWKDSHHDLAMDAPVLGDFSGVTFDHHGTKTRFFQKDGKPHVETLGKTYEVAHTFGVEPLQQYLLPVGNGRLQTLQVSWDTEKKQWFHIQDDAVAEDDPLHWTGLQFNWNSMCAECHSTNLRKNYDAASDSYDTTWSEIDVSCQACHGPGERHVAWAEAGEDPDDETMGLAFQYKGDDPVRQVESCARCHARRVVVNGEYEYGRPFLDHYRPVLLVEDRYHPDGQVLDEVFVYGSYLQSRMYAHGVRCTECHDPHSARMKFEGNLACARCHQTEPPPQFETLQKKEYDAKSHHFHEEGKPGSFCVDCHMPARTYMGNDPRRDHQFGIPRPDLTAKIGTPNACNQCHADKDTAWSIAAMDKWYPRNEPRAKHFGETFHAARAGEEGVGAELVALVGDNERSAIVRATAIEYLRRYPGPESLETVRVATTDPDALVRASAVEALQGMDEAFLRRHVAPLLDDPVRAVRIEAARVLAGLRGVPGLDAALDEFRQQQEATIDRPEAHLNLGVVASAMGDEAAAEAHYRRAVELAPAFLPVRFNLANLLNSQGRNEEARRHLEAVLAREPGNGEAHYSLGLLLVELGLAGEAEAHLAKAIEALPRRPRIRYNHGLLLQQLRRPAEAAKQLLAALALAPRDPEILNALAVLYAQQGRLDDAAKFARLLVELTPGQPGPARLLAAIERDRARRR
jgi:tetratricopeptide (TPR) repeat protein